VSVPNFMHEANV